MSFKITKEQTDKIVALNNLRDATKLLGGTIQHQIVVDSIGRSEKRFVITYDEKRKTASS